MSSKYSMLFCCCSVAVKSPDFFLFYFAFGAISFQLPIPESTIVSVFLGLLNFMSFFFHFGFQNLINCCVLSNRLELLLWSGLRRLETLHRETVACGQRGTCVTVRPRGRVTWPVTHWTVQTVRGGWVYCAVSWLTASVRPVVTSSSLPYQILLHLTGSTHCA